MTGRIAACVVCGGPVAVTAFSCPHCGYRPSFATSGVNGWAAGIVVAGALIGFAAFLPWESVWGVSLNGFQVGTAGVLALCLGMVIALLGLAQVKGRGIRFEVRVLASLGGLAAIGLALLCLVKVQDQVRDVIFVSPGVGIFAVAIGGGLAIGASLIAPGRRV
jgi:hypothetical protein